MADDLEILTHAIIPEPSGRAPPDGLQTRHALIVRITHWVNAVCVGFLLWSGGAILFAVPEFFIGHTGYEGMKPLFRLPIEQNGHFQTWDRLMHFSFAWLLLGNAVIYIIFSLVSGHLMRDLAPRHAQLKPSHLWADIRSHLNQRRFRRAAEAEYNVLQRLAYLTVTFGLGPLMVLTGLTMAPAVVAWLPWLEALFGGRHTARLIHFLSAGTLVAFILVHLWQVVATGPLNQVRAMITGRYRAPAKGR